MTTTPVRPTHICRLEDLFSRDADNQARETFLGSPINKLQRGLPKSIESLCPECRNVIPAVLLDDRGKVYMEKTCPEHGFFRELYWSDTAMYLRAERMNFGDGRGVSNPKVRNATKCPEHCGLCNMHLSHVGLANIDLTNRCNMACPICFANSATAGYLYEPDYDTVIGMLRALRDSKPVAGTVIQFSGGEPTLHPRFIEIVQAAQDMGFAHIQMASNGLKLRDFDFARALKAAGMHTVYLQFDGPNDEVHQETRGKAGYYQKKLEAIENCRRARLRITLVPTIARGFNDHLVGDILTFAIENCDVIGGISFQPVALTGRYDNEKREAMRYTLPDLVKDMAAQTGLVEPDDFFPISCTTPFSKLTSALDGSPNVTLSCHPHCSLATYMMLDRTDPMNTAVPIPRYLNVEGMMRDMNELAFKSEKSMFKLFTKVGAFNALRRHFDGSRAPRGLNFMKFLDSFNGVFDKSLGGKRHTDWMVFLVGGMHFMDSYNYDVGRVKRCVIHYSTPDGFMYPFCAYNSGPVFRDRVERRHSAPLI